MGRSVAALLAVLLWGGAAPASEEHSAETAKPRVLALFAVTVNAPAKEHADSVEALLASHLSEARGLEVVSRLDLNTLLDVERQKQLLGGGEDCGEVCTRELASAVGADLVVTSRLDRFGSRYVLTASLIEIKGGVSLARPRAEAEGEAELPAATRAVAELILGALGQHEVATDASAPAAADAGKHFILGLKVGNTLLRELAKFNLSGDVQLGYQFAPRWVGYVQVGVSAVRSSGEHVVDNVALIPSLLGVRHLYRVDHAFQPYWGVGLGVQINFGDRFKLVQSHGILPAVHGVGGFQYFLTRRFAVGIDASTNLAGLVVELASAEVVPAFNLNVHGALTWRW